MTDTPRNTLGLTLSVGPQAAIWGGHTNDEGDTSLAESLGVRGLVEYDMFKSGISSIGPYASVEYATIRTRSGSYDKGSLHGDPDTGFHYTFDVNKSEYVSQTPVFVGVSTSLSLGQSKIGDGDVLAKIRMGAGPVFTGDDVSVGLQPFDLALNFPVWKQLAVEANAGFVMRKLSFGGNNIGDALQIGAAAAYKF